jgi:lipocalin
VPGDERLVLPPGGRTVLRAPDAIARAVAATEPDPERRWLLRRPRPVRRSFLERVIDRGGGSAEQRRWMLEQDDDVRSSYVSEVLERAPKPDREAIWLLCQAPAVRASYVAEVLDGGV